MEITLNCRSDMFHSSEFAPNLMAMGARKCKKIDELFLPHLKYSQVLDHILHCDTLVTCDAFLLGNTILTRNHYEQKSIE